MATKFKTPTTKYHFVITYNGKDRHNYFNYAIDTPNFDFYFSISPTNMLQLQIDAIGIVSGDTLVELKYILDLFEDIQLYIKKYPGQYFDKVINYFSADTTSNIWLEYRE